MRKNKEKDTSVIPLGCYCYTIKGVVYKDGMPIVKLNQCPYRVFKVCNGVGMHWCNYLNVGELADRKNENNRSIRKQLKKLVQYFRSEKKMKKVNRSGWLLFDDCKICGINDPDELYEECGNVDIKPVNSSIA